VDADKTEWLSIPDVAELLDTSPGKVRRLVEERAVLGRKIEGVFYVAAALLHEGEPLAGVAGTATVLLDGGYGLEQTLDWLLTHHEELGVTPAEALRWGRKTEVRRIAQVLAL
jgi:hypothetical protein